MTTNFIKYLASALIFFVFISTFNSCTETSETFIPDVDHLNPSFQFIRMDSILELEDFEEVIKGIGYMKDNHPEFTNIFFKTILPLKGYNTESFDNNLKGFLNDPAIASLIDTCAQTFGGLEDVKADLKKALQFYQYYFPNETIPNFYSLISEYAYQVFIFKDKDRDGVGIGLDMFLGEDFDYKRIDPQNEAFSSYLTRTYNKDHMVKKIMEVIIDDRLGTERANNLLDQMVKEGKKLYLLDQILPSVHDSIIMEYSGEQWEWVNNNELEMWSFFLEEELLYETGSGKTFKYIRPSPGSPGMPPEAPGKTGAYIGWKIVQLHMKKNPELSIEGLLSSKDPQEFLNTYKPARRR